MIEVNSNDIKERKLFKSIQLRKLKPEKIKKKDTQVFKEFEFIDREYLNYLCTLVTNGYGCIVTYDDEENNLYEIQTKGNIIGSKLIRSLDESRFISEYYDGKDLSKRYVVTAKKIQSFNEEGREKDRICNLGSIGVYKPLTDVSREIRFLDENGEVEYMRVLDSETFCFDYVVPYDCYKSLLKEEDKQTTFTELDNDFEIRYLIYKEAKVHLGEIDDIDGLAKAFESGKDFAMYVKLDDLVYWSQTYSDTMNKLASRLEESGFSNDIVNVIRLLQGGKCYRATTIMSLMKMAMQHSKDNTAEILAKAVDNMYMSVKH